MLLSPPPSCTPKWAIPEKPTHISALSAAMTKPAAISTFDLRAKGTCRCHGTDYAMRERTTKSGERVVVRNKLDLSLSTLADTRHFALVVESARTEISPAPSSKLVHSISMRPHAPGSSCEKSYSDSLSFLLLQPDSPPSLKQPQQQQQQQQPVRASIPPSLEFTLATGGPFLETGPFGSREDRLTGFLPPSPPLQIN